MFFLLICGCGFPFVPGLHPFDHICSVGSVLVCIWEGDGVCVCAGVCVHVLLAQRSLMSRMMPKICIRVQVNNVMLRTLLQCFCQFPPSLFLNL